MTRDEIMMHYKTTNLLKSKHWWLK